jgi:hypothetical protein
MTRITPLRFTTLQCSQIGFTLVRTFKTTSKKKFGTDSKPTRGLDFAQLDRTRITEAQGRPAVAARISDGCAVGAARRGRP